MPEATQDQKFDWGKWGTILSSFAAAGGLVITAILGFYQYQEVRESNRLKLSDQARQVAVWVEQRSHGTVNVILENRSTDPVTSMYVFAPGREYKKRFTNEVRTNAFEVGVLPPCSRIMINFTPDAAGAGVDTFFRDSSGRDWMRLSTGKLEETRDTRGENWSEQSRYAVKKIDGCPK